MSKEKNMKTLLRKIKEVLPTSETKDSGYIYLNAEELTALINMRKVSVFAKSCGIDRYVEEGGNRYFVGFGSVTLSRKQAKESVKDFVRYNDVKGQPTFAKVYISNWSNDRYYISF